MIANEYRHIANRTILRDPGLSPGNGPGNVSQFDNPSLAGWVTMDLVENDETGLEEIRGLVCDGLDESVMTLQMRLWHKGGEEEVCLLPGTYRQLAYAETFAPDLRHDIWRLLEVVACGGIRDYFLVDSWSHTEVDSDAYHFLSPASFEAFMSNTPRQDKFDSTRLHIGEAHRLSPSEAADWLRIYKRPIPVHLDPERLGRPLADAPTPLLPEGKEIGDEPDDDPPAGSDLPQATEPESPKKLTMEIDGETYHLEPGEYDILGVASSHGEDDSLVCDETLIQVADKYFLAKKYLDLEVIGMSVEGQDSESARDHIGTAQVIEPQAASKWLDGYGKRVPADLETYLLGKSLTATLREKEEREEILKGIPPPRSSRMYSAPSPINEHSRQSISPTRSVATEVRSDSILARW